MPRKKADPYKMLGVGKKAKPEEVKRAYRGRGLGYYKYEQLLTCPRSVSRC